MLCCDLLPRSCSGLPQRPEAAGPRHDHGPGTRPRALRPGQGIHMATAQGLRYNSCTQGFKEASQVVTEEAASLCSSSLSLCSSNPLVCPDAGPVSLFLINLQLLWKAKFHEPLVFSHLLPSLHTYLPTSLHIDLPTHFSFFPCVVPDGPIQSSLVTV